MTNTKIVKLLRPLPANRTRESLENQFLVEKELADRLRKANSIERKAILSTMYDELFEKVPDHSRLSRRKSESETRDYNQSKMSLLRRFLTQDCTLLEFGSGDCQFAYECAKLVKQVVAVEIVDQRPEGIKSPDNFKLQIYDGDEVLLESDTIDVAFSDQLIEHLHSDDVNSHFISLYRIMKLGGVYLLRTPHAFTGPHDISKYFSDTPQGFHMKEYTFREIRDLTRRIGFRKIRCVMGIKGRFSVFIPFFYVATAEAIISLSRGKLRRALSNRLLPALTVAVYK